MSRLISAMLFVVAMLGAHLAMATTEDAIFSKRFYLGITEGRGWTTWAGLVPPIEKQNQAINISTPTYVIEGGNMWGLFAGYELNPYFALEAAYTHYSAANVMFDSMSLFAFENEGLLAFTTHTEMLSLIAKLMVMIPHTAVRVFSGAGLAEVHRYDIIKNNWQPSPTFAAGFNYNLSQRVMVELGANYTAGRGQSELNPTENYFPFIYSIFLRLGYRI